jgi:hypothetical protein
MGGDGEGGGDGGDYIQVVGDGFIDAVVCIFRKTI